MLVKGALQPLSYLPAHVPAGPPTQHSLIPSYRPGLTIKVTSSDKSSLATLKSKAPPSTVDRLDFWFLLPVRGRSLFAGKQQGYEMCVPGSLGCASLRLQEAEYQVDTEELRYPSTE